VSELPTHLELVVGEEQTIPLPGLGTAGYMWQERLSGNPRAIEVSWQRGFLSGAKAPAVGVSAPEVVTIRAIEPGEVTVRLVQVRAWQPNEAPNAEHSVAVHVT
jgi:predicted secreted protein